MDITDKRWLLDHYRGSYCPIYYWGLSLSSLEIRSTNQYNRGFLNAAQKTKTSWKIDENSGLIHQIGEIIVGHVQSTYVGASWMYLTMFSTTSFSCLLWHMRKYTDQLIEGVILFIVFKIGNHIILLLSSIFR